MRRIRSSRRDGFLTRTSSRLSWHTLRRRLTRPSSLGTQSLRPGHPAGTASTA